MNWEDIEDTKISNRVRDFYLYQAMLILSPLNETTFPHLTSKFRDLFNEISKNLIEDGFSVIKKEEPRDKFLASLARLSDLQLYLKKDEEIFDPPKKLSDMQTLLINTIPTPWK